MVDRKGFERNYNILLGNKIGEGDKMPVQESYNF